MRKLFFLLITILLFSTLSEAAPKKPSSLKVELLQEGTLSVTAELTWKLKMKESEVYLVEVQRVGSSGAEELLYQGDPITSFQDENIPYGESVYYQVRLIDEEEPSDWRDSDSVKVEKLIPPSLKEPEAVFDMKKGGVVLTWSVPENDLGYQVSIYRLILGKENLLETVPLGEGKYVDTKLTQSGEYQYKVMIGETEKNLAGNPVFTKNLSVIAEQKKPIMGLTASKIVGEGGNPKIKLTWRNKTSLLPSQTTMTPPPAEEIEMQLKVNEGVFQKVGVFKEKKGSYSSIMDSPKLGDPSSQVVKGVVRSGVTLVYRARRVGNQKVLAGPWVESSPVTFESSQFARLMVDSRVDQNLQAFKFFWDKDLLEPDVKGNVIVSRKLSSDKQFKQIQRVSFSKGSFVDQKIDPDLVYDYRFEVDGTGKIASSEPTDILGLRCQEKPLEVPEDISSNLLKNNGKNQISITWTPVPAQSSSQILIQRSENNQNFTNLSEVSMTKGSYLDTDIDMEGGSSRKMNGNPVTVKTYRYRFQAQDASGGQASDWKELEDVLIIEPQK